MSSFTERLRTTLIGIPLLLIVIFLIPHFGHLALALVATGFSILGSRELHRIINIKLKTSPNLHYVFGGLIPIAAWLSSVSSFSYLTELTLIFMLFVSFSIEIFSGAKYKKPFDNSIIKISVDSFSLLYPGYLLSFIVRINTFEQAAVLYALFLLCVFSNDIFAYIFGRLFGKNNKGIIKASPNKSVAGFIGGIVSATIVSVVATIFLKINLQIYQSIIIGFALAVTASIGDLIESVMKRSADVKDSGTLTPGRGGALDNIDSLVASAPLFYLLLQIFIK